MEDESIGHPAAETAVESEQNGPGARAVEALARAIAQEFVLVFDEFHEALLSDDETTEPPKVQVAGT